jgi:hypothetical protein
VAEYETRDKLKEIQIEKWKKKYSTLRIAKDDAIFMNG